MEHELGVATYATFSSLVPLAFLELGTKRLEYNNLLLLACDYCTQYIDCFFWLVKSEFLF